MEFNPSKCTVIQVTRSKRPIPSKYILHGHVLETVNCARYLVWISRGTTPWTDQVNRVSSSANKTLGFIKRNIRTKNQTVRSVAYKTLVRPILEYSSAVWSPSAKQDIDRLERVQRRAARWVLNDYNHTSSVTSMLDSLGWRSLQDRRSDARLCLFYKIVNGQVAIQMPSYIHHPIRVSRLLHPLAFMQIHTRVDYYKYSFFPLAIVQWNNLPADVAALPTFSTFRLAVSKLSHPIP